VEALASFVSNCTLRGAPSPPRNFRVDYAAWITPSLNNDEVGATAVWEWSNDPLARNQQIWITKNSPQLANLDRETLYEADRKMRVSLDGVTLYAPNTQNRLIAVAKTSLSSAVRRGLIDAVPWPRRETGAKAKSDQHHSDEMSYDEVPNVKQLIAILDAIPSHQPASHLYRSLSSVCGFAGLRPGEAVVLEVADVHLPDIGWGSIRVTKAWSGVDGMKWHSDLEEIAGPKTQRSRRTVPIPPILVAILSNWIEQSGIDSGPLFLTKAGTRPTQSNWLRALRRACERAGWPSPLTPYGLRRTNASHLAQAIPIAEAAARLGHSVEVLTKHYVKRVASQVELSNEVLDGAFSYDDHDSTKLSNHSSSAARRIRS
jgi:integrase